MGLGAALQQIGTMYLQRNWQQKDQAKAAEQQKVAREQERKEWEDRQRFLARLGAPQERVRQVYDEQLKNAIAVREQWDPDAGSWKEQGRDLVPPKDAVPQITKYRQGDQEITAIIDPNNPDSMRELGRGNAFAPNQRAGGGALSQLSARGGAPKTAEPAPSKFEATRSQEEAKALGQNAKQIIEKAAGARESLAIIGEMEKLMQGGLSTGPMDQYLPGKDRQRFDVLQKQLVGPVIKSMFGSTQLSEGDRKAAEASLPGLGRYEDVNKDVLAQMRAKAEAAIKAEADLSGRQDGAAGSSRNNPVQISSETEADSLPPGTWVILNGRLGQT